MPHPPTEPVLAGDCLAGACRAFEKATTLPSEAFTSAAVWQQENERILGSAWLCAGRADQIPEPGDYFTLDLLDDKLVVVRDGEGTVRVLSRICRHRAAEVVTGTGNARSFQCPYHAWTYRLDGSLQGAPLMKEVEGFDKATCRLPEIRSEPWEGWIFVNFDAEAEALGPQLAPLSRILAPYRMSDLVAVETATFESPFNWKVLVDNFMEAYHHIAIHRDTLEPLFPATLSNTPDNDGPYSLLFMPTDPAQAEDGPVDPLPAVGPLTPEEEHRLVAAVVYPFHLFAPSASSLAWYQLLPTSHDHFTLRIYTCFPRETLDDAELEPVVAGLQALTRHIHQQDIAACEGTWAGLNARSFESGRLAPLERPIWQFNQWWIERMTER